MKILMTCVLFLVLNCSFSEKKISNRNQCLQEFGMVQKKYDSCELKYWDALSAYEYTISIFKDSMIVDYNDGRSKRVDGEEMNKIKDYIDLFFLSKKIPIEIDRKKRNDYLDVGSYSSLSVSFYKKGNHMEGKVVMLGDDEYEITFHSKFEEFVSVVRSLVSEGHVFFMGRRNI